MQFLKWIPFPSTAQEYFKSQNVWNPVMSEILPVIKAHGENYRSMSTQFLHMCINALIQQNKDGIVNSDQVNML